VDTGPEADSDAGEDAEIEKRTRNEDRNTDESELI
jgi:hypothetical protein